MAASRRRSPPAVSCLSSSGYDWTGVYPFGSSKSFGSAPTRTSRSSVVVNGWYSSDWSFLACSILTTSPSRSRATQSVTTSPEGRVIRQRSQGCRPWASSPMRRICRRTGRRTRRVEFRLERIAGHDLVGRGPGRRQDPLRRGPQLPDRLEVRAHDLDERRALDLRLDALALAAHGDLEALVLRERQRRAVAVLRNGLQSPAAAERRRIAARRARPDRDPARHGPLGIRMSFSCGVPRGSAALVGHDVVLLEAEADLAAHHPGQLDLEGRLDGNV